MQNGGTGVFQNSLVGDGWIAVRPQQSKNNRRDPRGIDYAGVSHGRAVNLVDDNLRVSLPTIPARRMSLEPTEIPPSPSTRSLSSCPPVGTTVIG